MRGKIFFLLSVAFVLFSLTPMFYELSRVKDIRPERYFELVHNFPTDYNFYKSRIREGLEGRLTVVEKYTSEPHAGSFLHILYLAFGWAGKWTRVPWHLTDHIYHMARIVLGVTLLMLIASVVRRAFASFWWQLLAYFLAVSASSWPKLAVVDGVYRFGGYMAWWSVMDSLQRITFIPHLLAGQALLVFILGALGNRTVMGKPGNWILLGGFAFVLGIIFPPGFLFVVAAMGVATVLETLYAWPTLEKKKRVTFLKGLIVPRLIIAILGIPALVYLQSLVSFYPWKRLAEFDIVHPLPFQYYEYFQAMGPILPLGMLGLIAALITRSVRMAVAVGWVIAWGLLLFFFQFVPQQSPLRFSEMIPHVPLGILAAYFFSLVYGLAVKRKGELFQLVKVIILTVPVLYIVTNLFYMYSSYLWQRDFVDHKIRADIPLVPTGSYVMYPLKDFVDAIRFIQDTTTRNEIVLSETTAGNYIPVYSGNTVFVGHANTVKSEEKEQYVKLFFGGFMTPAEAKAWLARERLNVIFFGPQEKEIGGIDDLKKTYPFLTEVFRNTFVVVYRAQ